MTLSVPVALTLGSTQSAYIGIRRYQKPYPPIVDKAEQKMVHLVMVGIEGDRANQVFVEELGSWAPIENYEIPESPAVV